MVECSILFFNKIVIVMELTTIISSMYSREAFDSFRKQHICVNQTYLFYSIPHINFDL